MAWDWEKMRQSRNYNTQHGYYSTAKSTKDNYYSTVDNDYRMKRRRNKAIINICVITFVLICILIGCGFMANSYDESQNKTTEAFSKLGEAINYKKENVLKNSYETCVDGRKVVIINGTTYYAGKVDTWGDVETIMCD